ncbi:MAG: BlaI/MecI/CopY family transcriptional regulator [Bacteroidales bacterium]|jgi:predicted transcriptional regulator|nr:BlaI/MecI/CopY family transcriptional regulator [Bacteroidales bacterium]
MSKKLFDESLNLTKAEEQVMQLLWEKEQAFVNDLLEIMPAPKPAYNTVSTIIRILEKKGFVAHRSFGKTYQYYPIVSQSQYVSNSLNRLNSTYFKNSFAGLVNFFVEEGNLKRKEIDEISELLQTLKQKNGKR